MIVSKSILAKIKDIVEKHYNALMVSVLGRDVLKDAEIERLRHFGFDVENRESLISLIYYNNVLNDLLGPAAPTSIEEMRRQQTAKPETVTSKAAEEHLNEMFAQSVDKIKGSIQSGFEGAIREYNLTHRNEMLQDLGRPEARDQLIRESTVGKLKQTLKDLSEDGSRLWSRVAITETSNALGMGAIDRIAEQNKGKDFGEVYVYRISVQDAALCTHCRRFYVDSDGSPVLYKLSTILSNGSNYGRKVPEWKPVAGATHPNERCSGILELRPGWKLRPYGGVEFIGQDAWRDYVLEKLRG